MGKQLDRWRFSYLVHPAIALGVVALIGLGFKFAGFSVWWMLLWAPLFALFGYWREKLQHVGEKLSGHQLVEALNWSVGAALATGAWWRFL